MTSIPSCAKTNFTSQSFLEVEYSPYCRFPQENPISQCNTVLRVRDGTTNLHRTDLLLNSPHKCDRKSTNVAGGEHHSKPWLSVKRLCCVCCVLGKLTISLYT